MNLRELLETIQGLLPGRAGLPDEERRRLVRLRCYIPVQLLQPGRKPHDAVVVEMGVDGLRFRTRYEIDKKTEVHVEYPHKVAGVKNHRVRCRVIWTRKGSNSPHTTVGVRYEDTPANLRGSWVKAVLRELGFEERMLAQKRSAIRVPGDLPASVAIPGDEFVGGARALNVGVGGVLLQTDSRLKQGQTYRVSLGPAFKLNSLMLAASCLRCEHQSGDVWVSSLRFTDPSAEQVRLLGKYLMAMIRSTQK